MEGQKGSFPRSRGSQLRQMYQKPPLTTAGVTGLSGPTLPFPRVPGALLVPGAASSEQWQLPCQGHTFRASRSPTP